MPIHVQKPDGHILSWMEKEEMKFESLQRRLFMDLSEIGEAIFKTMEKEGRIIQEQVPISTDANQSEIQDPFEYTERGEE